MYTTKPSILSQGGIRKLQRLAFSTLSISYVHTIIDIHRHNPLWDFHSVLRLQWRLPFLEEVMTTV